jgi:flagellar P-ring protein precursor FlgI
MQIKHNILIIVLMGLFLSVSTLAQAGRIKDIASVKGVRNNQLVGYGLVVGLDSTGDSTKTPFTTQALKNMLESMGVHVNKNDLKVKNVAGVLVTTSLPPFAKIGQTIDVTLSSLGDAKSLQGGTLIATPLKGLDKNIYALAQGPISIGGFEVQGTTAGSFIQKNHITVAKIPNGATVEREVPVNIADKETLTLSLHNPDFTTVTAMVDSINSSLGGNYAVAKDGATAEVSVPNEYQHNTIGLLAKIENINVQQDLRAKVIMDERTGTVVMGANVQIGELAVAHGNLSLEITAANAGAGPTLSAKEGKEKLILMKESVTLNQVVRALNALGTTPRDLISIFQSIQASGALQAELEVI